jgi:pimeloyl-ACP methyl ester carboxylesterase
VRAPFESHVLAGAGHFAHEETPEAFTSVLLDWLAGLPR